MGPTEVFDEMVASYAQAAESDDPLFVEMMTSDLLGMWWSADPGSVELIGEALIEHAEQVVDANALALVTALGALAPGDLAAKATEAARVLAGKGVPVPPWTDAIGKAVPGACWCWGDVFGDVVSVLCAFDGPAGEHAVCVLIDRSEPFGGYAKDAYAVDNPEEALAEISQALAENEEPDLFALRELEPSRARALIENAMHATDLLIDPDVAETFPEFRALALSRCRLLREAPEPQAPDQAALVTEFLTDAGLDRTGSERRCAELFVEFGCEEDTGDPLRVSPLKTDMFLFGSPTIGSLSEAETEALPDVLAAYTEWAAKRTGMNARAVEVALQAAHESADVFRNQVSGTEEQPDS